MKHIERIRPGFVVFVDVSCRIVVCNVEVYFPLYETELYKPHYNSTNYTYKWHVNCFMKKATGGPLIVRVTHDSQRDIDSQSDSDSQRDPDSQRDRDTGGLVVRGTLAVRGTQIVSGLYGC